MKREDSGKEEILVNYPLHVTSEIGELRTVLLHRPGREVENLTPEYLERLLFDDIPYLPAIQKDTTISPRRCATAESK